MTITKEYLTQLAPDYIDEDDMAELEENGKLVQTMLCRLHGMRLICLECGYTENWVHGVGWVPCEPGDAPDDDELDDEKLQKLVEQVQAA